MATQHNFRIKNGLEIAGTERISSAGAFSGSLASATTATTQSALDNSTKIATTAYTDAAITSLIDSSPGALNTLNELASALGDDANFSTTVNNSIALKAPLASPDFTGQVQVTNSATTVQEFIVTGNNTRSALSMQSKDTSGNAVDLRMHSLGDGPRGEIFTFTNHDLAFATNNAAPQLTLKTNGNLGLGTGPNVDELLHIEKSSGTTIVKTQVAANSIVGFEIQKTGSTTSNWRIVDGQTVNGNLEIYDVTDSRSVMMIDGDGDIGMGVTPATHAKLTLGGTAASYSSVLAFDNNTAGGATFFMLASDNTWSAGANKFLMGHGTPSSSATDIAIDADGRVGIGATSPSAKLHVKSAGTGNVFYVESSDGHHLGGFYQESDTRAAFNVRDASGNVKVNLDAGGDSWFTGGQVGIGTSSPASPLHVKTTNQSIQIRNTGNDNVGLEIYRDSDGAKGASIGWGNGNANLEIKNYRNDGQSGGPYANIDFFTGGTDADSPDFNPTRRMRIQQTGEVGIGTDDPTRSIHTKSSSVTVGSFESTSSSGGMIGFVDSNTTDDVHVRVGAIGDNLVLQAGGSTKMTLDSNGKIAVTNNKPIWSGSYGGALFLKGNNATSDRYARICTVDSTGAAINNGLTVNNNGSTTIDCGETYSLNVSGNGAGLRFSTGSNQRIYWNSHRALEGAADGSLFQVGEGFTTMLVQSREKYTVDGATYGRVIIRFNATTSGDRLTAITANLNTLLGLSTGDYGQWTVEFGGYAGSGTNGCTGSFTIGGYTGHNYAATNHNSYGAGTINVGYSSTSGAETGRGPLSYHPVQNNGMYIASGEVWVYVPAAQQVGIMIKNNGSQNLAGTMTVTATVRG